jgi:hypothetical protein
MKNESIGETIVSIFRNDWNLEDEEKDECNKISNGTRRNERCKVTKQVNSQNLDWKYVNCLICFADTIINKEPLIKRLFDVKDKYGVCKKELNDYKAYFDIEVQKKVNEVLKDKVNEQENETIKQLQEEIETLRNINRNTREKLDRKYNEFEEFKKSTKVDIEQERQKFDEYVTAIKNLKKSGSTSSLSSNEGDSKYKKKYKSLKKDYEKLQMKHLKLKEKLDDNDDTSDDETSDDD